MILQISHLTISTIDFDNVIENLIKLGYKLKLIENNQKNLLIKKNLMTGFSAYHKLALLESNKNFNIEGPIPADTIFLKAEKDSDVVLAMFHDQGLPVLKYAGFGEAVNITLGLPFVRTSVDHGTAFDIAGKGKASSDSLIAAIELAIEMIK